MLQNMTDPSSKTFEEVQKLIQSSGLPPETFLTKLQEFLKVPKKSSSENETRDVEKEGEKKDQECEKKNKEVEDKEHLNLNCNEDLLETSEKTNKVKALNNEKEDKLSVKVNGENKEDSEHEPNQETSNTSEKSVENDFNNRSVNKEDTYYNITEHCYNKPTTCDFQAFSEEQNDDSLTTISDSDNNNTLRCQIDDIVEQLNDLEEKEKENSTAKDLSDIIKKQLSSLRNTKKKGLPEIRKTSLIFSHNLRKKRKSRCNSSPILTLNQLKEDVEENKNTETVNENSLVSLSDEAGFVILDVTGGVDRIDDVKLQENSKNGDSSLEETPRFIQVRKDLTESFEKDIAICKESSVVDGVLDNSISNERHQCGMAPELETEGRAKEINSSEGTNKNPFAPFVSNDLEDFLKKDHQLRISFAVPKLGATEGINESSKVSPFEEVTAPRAGIIQKSIMTTYGERRKLKIKTLAEMRRYMEKQKQKNKEVENMKNENENEDQPKRKSLKRDNAYKSFRNSYAHYNNKRLLLRTKSPGRYLGVIHKCWQEAKRDRSSSPLRKKTNKLSLLSSLLKKGPDKVKYKPGPLSKKHTLQDTSTIHFWKTEIKKLPKVYLEVSPECGKAVNPKISHLIPIFDSSYISEDRANFALTALKGASPHTFKYEVPYRNNQEVMVVRKQQGMDAPIMDLVTNKECNTENIENDVKDVIEGLINYVEIKDIADSLIKQDDDLPLKKESKVASTTPKVNSNKQWRKLKYELENKLNCKVINVAEDESEGTSCTKLHCRLGCVCKSLAGNVFYRDHCRLIDCMFECKCPPKENEIMITNNTTLSAETVSHIDDNVKKNLAKEERDFTQTLIHTDNNVILVGSGGRSKSKRKLKAPKKYTDYVENFDEFLLPPKRRHVEFRPCTVDLLRLELKDVQPYCLYHNMHNCHCKGEFVGPINKPTKPFKKYYSLESLKNAIESSIESIRAVRAARSVEQKQKVQSAEPVQKTIPKSVKRGDCEQTKKDVHVEPVRIEVPKINIIRTEGDKYIVGCCARTTMVDRWYLHRNKDSRYSQSLRKKVLSEWKAKTADEKQLCKRLINPQTSSGNSEVPSPYPPPIRKANKRKQSFDIRNDIVELNNSVEAVESSSSTSPDHYREFAIQRRKKKCITNRPVFENGIRLHSKHNFELLKYIGEENPSEFLTLVPWDSFMKNFNEGTISLCCRENSTKLLVFSSESNLPKDFVDIGDVKRKTELIKWILSDTLPLDKQRSLFLLVLVERKDHYQISGYCAKNRPKKSVQQQTATKHLPSSLVISKVNNEDTSVAQESTSSDSKTTLELILQNDKEQKAGTIPMLKSALEKMKLEIMIDETRRTASLKLQLNKLSASKTNQQPQKEETDPQQSHTKPPSLIPLTRTRSFKCYHKDMHNLTQEITITNKFFTPRTLHLRVEDTKDPTETKILAALPQTSNEIRWRLVYLNSDFSFLSFFSGDFSIKYTDLMDAAKFAYSSRFTLILRSKLCDRYRHPLFGIYCVPNGQGKLFIGPFFDNEEHNVTTLRYVHGTLIDTEAFNKMLGKKPSEKTPIWLYEYPSDGLVIDITQEDENDNRQVESEDNCIKDFDNLHLLHPPFVEYVKSPVKFANRYFVTNIPCLGHLEAYQGDCKTIDIYWPTGGKIIRFANQTLAKMLILQYLSLIFCPVPKEFQLNVVIATSPGKNDKPIDPKYFTSPERYICGEFGIYNISNVPKDILNRYNISSVEELLKQEEREEEDTKRLLQCFTSFVESSRKRRKFNETIDILKWAHSEIFVSVRLGQNYLYEKQELQDIINQQLARRKDLLNSLPDEKRTEYLEHIGGTVDLKQKRAVTPTKNTEGATLTAAETIEIVDSDEECTTTPKPSTSRICIFKKIQKKSPPDKLLRAENRLLKNATLVKKLPIIPGRSLLKDNEEKQNMFPFFFNPISTKIKLRPNTNDLVISTSSDNKQS